MIVPNECIKWLKLQRTGYKDPVLEYKKQIEKEYLEMFEYLPKKAGSILDIGCGIAGIDVLLHKHYSGPELYLLDKSEISKKIYYGYKDEASSYNSFLATEKMMKANYIKNFTTIDANNELPEFRKYDLIISLLSCGYHYPVTEYLTFIKNRLSENGALIIDVREWTDGIKTIKSVLPNIRIISHYNKSKRIIARFNK